VRASPSTSTRSSTGWSTSDSFFEIKPLFASELVVGFGRIDGESVGIVANNSAVKGGVLFSDSADKATRFIWLCDAFSVPLIYLADVPGFMIGSEVERGGIIRHGAKMVSAVASATVPQFCVVVRKAYGAGLYAMGGPGFGPDATIALPTARIAVMGPEAAVNAVYANKIAEVEAAEGVQARDAFVAARRAEYEADVDLERLAADLVLDQVIEADALRDELRRRLNYAARRDRHFSDKRRVGVRRSCQARPSSRTSSRSSGRETPTTVLGSPSIAVTYGPPKPSIVKAPATASGSPVAM
jgi:acetyl-CoA carboxylase carboxyltransferase component